MTTDPAHRHGGADAGWYVPDGHGWQRISDAEVWDHDDAAHFMSDPDGRHGQPHATNPATQIRWALGYIRERYGQSAGAKVITEAPG